ncbi:MAG TPA: DUF262 domain-containing protein [Allosphingosinicella sp.]|jgi:hypothetical protein|nr:DUF262 domain-containing protein [Allosphingosinicella sp.]
MIESDVQQSPDDENQEPLEETPEPPPGDSVEFSEEDDVDVGAGEAAQFGQAVLWGTDWTVETIIAQIARGNIEINPQFQRRDAWSRPAKSRFIESIILGLPIPQVVLAERRNQRGRYLILDGKQRLLSLMQYAGLAEASSNNRFGLSGLQVRKDLARKKYSHLEDNPDLANEFDAFRSHTIRAIVIRNWPSMNFLHLVFHRLNSGSLKLSPQELRQALVTGQFTAFADDFALQSRAIHRLLSRSLPDPRMRDTELLVRYLSFQRFLPQYAGRMKEFLDESCERFNATWGEIESDVREQADAFITIIEALEIIFEDRRIARKQGSRLFNRSIFDALTYYAADDTVLQAMKAQPAAVRHAYEETIADEAFQLAVESDTAGIPHTASRLRIWGEKLAQALGITLAVPHATPNTQGQHRFVLE